MSWSLIVNEKFFHSQKNAFFLSENLMDKKVDPHTEYLNLILQNHNAN